MAGLGGSGAVTTTSLCGTVATTDATTHHHTPKCHTTPRGTSYGPQTLGRGPPVPQAPAALRQRTPGNALTTIATWKFRQVMETVLDARHRTVGAKDATPSRPHWLTHDIEKCLLCCARTCPTTYQELIGRSVTGNASFVQQRAVPHISPRSADHQGGPIMR